MPPRVPNTYPLARSWSTYTTDLGVNYQIFTTTSNINANLAVSTPTAMGPLLPEGFSPRYVVAIDVNYNRTKVPIFSLTSPIYAAIGATFLKDGVVFKVVDKYGESSRQG